MTWEIPGIPLPVERLVMIAASILGVLIMHFLVFALLQRAAARTRARAGELLIARLRRPSRWLVLWIALAALVPVLERARQAAYIWGRIAGLVGPALVGWTAVAALAGVVDIIQDRADITVADNLAARRRRTRAGILHRIGVFVIALVTFCVMMMSIPSIRTIGVTLVASAGLAGLALGAAAQPALKNLIAGIQMAFTEPIRLDDVVIIENEWGRIEEIRLTYVVVRIWDDRRLVVPVSKFLESSFQNWTRQSSELLGSVFWYLDASADVARLRERLERVVKDNPRWDGRFFNLQVTDMKDHGAMELRALMTAKDASTAFDLRCDVREAMLAYIREEMPEALVRRRDEVVMVGSDQPEVGQGAVTSV